MLRVQNLHKSYGLSPVIQGIDFHVRRGECFGLLGPNGAGKTTTIRCCLGLSRIDSGSIHLLGACVQTRGSEVRRRVGVAPQFDNLDGDFSVADNLTIFGTYFGIPWRESSVKSSGLLQFVGLSEKASARVEELSGGMKRRLTLAKALINDPQVLFLDEPTTGLDPQARHLVWQCIKALLAEGRTVVLTTHFMEEAQRLCDRVAIVDGGVLIAHDSPARLIERELQPFVVEIFGPGTEDFVRAHALTLCDRAEILGDAAYCYCTDAERMMAALAQRPSLRSLRRPTNLEDVFLKLTGRDLRD